MEVCPGDERPAPARGWMKRWTQTRQAGMSPEMRHRLIDVFEKDICVWNV